MANQATARSVVERPTLIRNGVHVSGLIEVIRAVQADPGLADFRFRAENQWQDGAQNETRIRNFYGTRQELAHREERTLQADEPPALLGKDEGNNPVEILLAALASCMTTALVYHAAANGIELERVESDYEGDIDLRGFLDLDPKIRKGYREIRVNFRVKSEADRQRLAELAKKSPVFDVITHGTNVLVNVDKI